MAPENSNSRYPLYNTTFSLHRVSPLYTHSDSTLDNATLGQYAHRFRDILAGEVLRGVRVGLAPEEDILARVGPLQKVTWTLLVEEETWNEQVETQMDQVDTAVSLSTSRGMLVTVSYEKITYQAIFIREERPINEGISIFDTEEQ